MSDKSFPKYAQVPDRPKPRGAPATIAPTQTKPTIAPASQGSSAIRDMKVSMQDLADAITRDTSAATMPKQPGKVDPGMASKETSNAKQSFNNFVVDLHAGASSSEEEYDVNQVMSTLQSLKPGSKEFKISGNWDTSNPNDMTTQALKDIVAFVGGLLNLENVGFAGKQTYYTKDQWQKLKNFLDAISAKRELKPTPEQKDKWARDITTHLKSMLKLYNHYFRDQFLRHESLRPLIEGHAAFETYDVPLTEGEQQLIDDGASISLNIPGITRGAITFPLRALKSPADFSSFLQRIGFEGSPEKALVSIKKQLGTK